MTTSMASALGLSNLLKCPSGPLLFCLKCLSITQPLLLKRPAVKPPKKPGSPYSIFVQKHFRDASVEKYDKDTVKNRIKELSVMWKGMSKEEQKPYTDLFKDQNDAYNVEKEVFFGKMSSDEMEKYKKDKKKYMKKKAKFAKIRKEKLAGTHDPPPRLVSGMNLYLSEQLTKEQFVDRSTHQKRFSEIVSRWKTLGNEEKKPYIDEGISITENRITEYCERHPEYRNVLEAKKRVKV